MRKRLSNILSGKLIRAVAVIAACLAMFPSVAEVFYSDPYIGYAEETFMDMDFEPNLATPAVADVDKAAVSAYMTSVAKSLKGPFTVDMIRDNEVIVVSIRADRLFEPLDTMLCDGADRAIAPLFRLMTEPDKYKVVIAMHTDDTGNETWQDKITTSRLYSVYDLLLDKIDSGEINPDIIIIPFALGAADPIVDNDTRRNRAENRRLEFFFIPGPEIITKAHQGTLN